MQIQPLVVDFWGWYTPLCVWNETPAYVWALIGLLVTNVVVCTGAAAFAARGWPIGLRRLAKGVRDDVDALAAEWQRVRGDLAVKVEQLDELEETIEKKRARAAAAASYAARQGGGQAAPGADPATLNRSELRRLARQRGFAGV